MEFINKIEILGTVGNVRINEVGKRRVARVSVATDYAYQDSAGNQCIDVTWHSVTIWTGQYDQQDIADIKQGSHLHVIGRLRQYRYTDASGMERSGYEVIAQKWNIKDTSAQ